MANTLNKINSGGIKDDSIVNADIKSDAAIALSKLASTPAVLTGSTNNTVCTVTGANAIAGEASLTFDAGLLKIDDLSGTAGKGRLEFGNSGEQYIEGFDTGNGGGGSYLSFGDGGAEYLRINSSGKVGLGTSSPTSALEILGHNQVTFGSMPETILSYGTTSAYDSGSAGSGINLGGKYNASDTTLFGGIHGVKENTTINNYAGALVFSTRANGGASAEKLRIGSNGNVTVNDGDLVIGTAGHGIDFSATSDAGGMTNELLDDYEEGTFTPTCTGQSGSLTLSTAVGNYTKIGNVVYISYEIVASSGSTGTFPRLGGLPYTSSSSAAKTIISSKDKVGVSYGSSYSDMYFRIDQNATTAVGIAERTDGTTHTGSNLDFTGTLRGSGFYFV